jgi:ParB-like chromosome segregation protein Spo0J
VSETLKGAPSVCETPTRQSGQENVFGFTGWRVGAIIPDYPFRDMRPYTPRWVWPPSFKHTEQYAQLFRSIRESGIFLPLLVLPDGQVIDGQHRYASAKELGLESVPVRIIDVPLPLKEADQLAIEYWAVYDTIARRHLTKAQATEMLYDLLRGRNEVQTKLARLANLKRGNRKADTRRDPSHVTVEELASRAGKSPRSVERAVTVLRHAPPEIQAQLRSGRLSLGGAERAMKAAQAAANGPDQAIATPAKSPRTTPVEAAARTRSIPSAASAPMADDAKPESLPPAPTLGTEARSVFASVAETFADSARALVRKARTWDRGDREALEQLTRVLGQIETGFRDGGTRAREGPRK